MSANLHFEITRNKQRLEYYTRLKTTGAKAPAAIDKWIAIYQERVERLEKQAQKEARKAAAAEAGATGRAASASSRASRLH